ncbi:Uncharacterised protein [Vibrio cholerae]|nr:Uncharacterised protein [Vibrio cholerae]
MQKMPRWPLWSSVIVFQPSIAFGTRKAVSMVYRVKVRRSMLSRIIGSNCSSNMVWRKVIFSTFLTLLCGLYKKPVLSKLKPSAVNTLLAQCGVLTPKVSASFVVLPYQKV